MTNQINNQPEQAKKQSNGLMTATSIFALLYLIFFIISFIPGRMFGGAFGEEGSPVSGTEPFEPFDQEQIFVKLLFLLFLVGYLVVRKHEGIGGAVFILWYVAVWLVELIVIAPIEEAEGGFCIVAGVPIFVLGILFVMRWNKERIAEALPPAP